MNTPTILITGARGLVGTALTVALQSQGARVRALDLAADGDDHGDVRDPTALARAVDGCDGVVHLAAVSRVVWGEREPERCHATNVEGTHHVLAAALATRSRPWVLFASSREVYGHADTLPVDEDAPMRPMNVYGRSKVAAEALTLDARARGLTTAVARLSNVYGRARDHVDRVVPAFVRAAARGEPLRVEGPDHLFDFTFVDDVARGLVAMVHRLAARETLPPIHFVSGEGTTLGALADLAVTLAGSPSAITVAPSRSYDVARFRGDPSRARAVLGWAPRVSLREGVARLLDEVRAEGAR